MALVVGKLALPSDELVRQASLSMTNQDGTFPVTRAQSDNPAQLAKATTNATVVTVNCGGNVTPVGVAIINSNATSASISNAAGLNQAITIPALDAEGQRVHAWKDLTGLASRTDDIFDITLSRPSGILTFGRLVLVVAWKDVNWPAKGPAFDVQRPGTRSMITDLGTEVIHYAGIRTRSAEATFDLAEDAAMWRSLDQSGQGSNRPFLLIPDITVNDAWWVRQPVGFRERPGEPGFTEIARRFQELSSGPPNG